MLQLKDVRKVYDGKARVVALDGVTLSNRRGRDGRGDGAVGLGEVDSPEPHGRPRRADVGGAPRGRGGPRDEERGGAVALPADARLVRLSGLPPDADAHGRAERRAAAPPRGAAGGRGAREGAEDARGGRPRRADDAPPRRALRRRAAARRHRAGARHRRAAPPRRRADGEPRHRARRGDPPAPEVDPRGARDDDRHGDARPARRRGVRAGREVPRRPRRRRTRAGEVPPPDALALVREAPPRQDVPDAPRRRRRRRDLRRRRRGARAASSAASARPSTGWRERRSSS